MLNLEAECDVEERLSRLLPFLAVKGFAALISPQALCISCFDPGRAMSRREDCAHCFRCLAERNLPIT